jgi:hypothetical protein
MPACQRFMPVLSIFTALILAPLAAAQTAAPTIAKPAAAAAAAYKTPRTSFGQPSLEGVWTTDFVLPLESTPMAPNLTISEEGGKQMVKSMIAQISRIPSIALDPEIVPGLEAADGLALVRGERRTRAVVEPADGKMPMTPEARRSMTAASMSFGGMNNPEERPNWERCVALFGQPPVTSTGSSNQRRIVQTPKEIVFHTEYGDEVRIIPLTDTHKPKVFHSALGDSIARWDGDTLVIETIGLPDKDRVRLFPTMLVPGTAKVVEKLTRLSPTELLYQYTIEDPSVYTRPWLAEYSMYLTDKPMYEFSCHAGNYSLPNIMRAERIKEEKAAAKKKD